MPSQDIVTQAIVHAVKNHLRFAHYKVFYFGSRATGKATPRSDFDVGIEAGQEIPLEVMAKIEETLDDIPILQKIDVVDFSAVSAEFRRHAGEAMKIIYEQ